MENESITTKQKIQQTALDLFSRKGYTAVSIRDIGKLVGIKESSIYYHFKNKQDIFESLLLEVQQITDKMKESFNSRFEKIVKLEEADFVKVGIGVLEGYLLDTHINKFIRMLAMEQHVNEEAAKLYRNILFEAPLKQNEEVFKLMMDKGYCRQDDAERLAVEYYSPIYFTFERYFSRGKVSTETKNMAIKELTVHIKKFYERYIK